MDLFAHNEGTVDRTVRIVLGLGLLALTVVGPQTLWGLVGVLPLVSGLAGTCPLYSVIGIRTCPMREGKPHPNP